MKKSLLKKENEILLQKVIGFEKMTSLYPPIGMKFPVSHWDLKIEKEYYKLRKELLKLKSTGLFNPIMELNFNAWILTKYVFEGIFILLHLILFSFYIIKVPIFKGMISFYIGFFLFTYFIFRNRIILLERNIISRIYQIIKCLKKLDEFSPR